jgi:hypothetical protein
MSQVLCAIRGGPSSRWTIAQAIDLAQEVSRPLCFLYVVSLDRVLTADEHLSRLFQRQLRQLAESVLRHARELAESREIVAEYRVRYGLVGREIAGLCRELDAGYLVLGQPRLQDEDSFFTPAQFARFAEHLQGEIGARVVIAEERPAPRAGAPAPTKVR